MTYIGQYDSPLGKITLACDGQNLTGLWFDGQKYFGSTITPPVIYADAPPLDAAAEWLDEYFSGRIPSCAPPLKLAGTPFMLKVWAFLRTVPYGKTVTYKEIAEAAPRLRAPSAEPWRVTPFRSSCRATERWARTEA